MQITKHRLKKPDDDTFYDIEDFNYNTDILEEHLDDAQLHVKASDIAQITETTTLSQIDETDNNFTMWGKVKKAISTLVSHITNVATGSTLGHIKIGTGIQINSGTASVKLTDSVSTDDSTTALSAKAGKGLNEVKLDKSGGTLSGRLIKTKGSISHTASGVVGSAGYVAFCKITILASYANMPIRIKLAQREKYGGEIEIRFTNMNSNDPTLSGFFVGGDLATLVISKVSTSVWKIYLQKNDNYDSISINDISFPTYLDSKVAIDWIDEHSMIQPSGTVATNSLSDTLNGKAPVNHASVETKYGLGNTSSFGHVKLNDTYAANIGGVASGIAASQAALYNAYMAAVGTITNTDDYIHDLDFTKVGRLVIFGGIYTLPSSLNSGVWNIGTVKYSPAFDMNINAVAVSATYGNCVQGGYIDGSGKIFIQNTSTIPAGTMIRVTGSYFSSV